MTTELATTTNRPQRVSLIAAMANRYQMDPEAFTKTIRATVMPSGATNEQMAAFLLVAHEHDLNPITKEIYAFPAKGGGVTPVVGIDGWINLAQRRPEFDGLEHEWEHGERGEVISCTCRIYRKDRSRPIVVTEFMDECRCGTAPWKSHPRRMLRHKATIQAIRYAFGFAGIRDEDDAEVIYANATVVDPKPSNVTNLNARLAASVERESPAAGSQPPPVAPQSPEVGDPEPTTDHRSSAGPSTSADAASSPSDAASVTAHEQAPEEVDGNLDDGDSGVDARGIPWDGRVHSSSRARTADGARRRKRGVDPALVERIERELMTDGDPTANPPSDESGQDQAQTQGQPDAPPLTIDRILTGIASAEDLDTIDEWLDLSRDINPSVARGDQIRRAANERCAYLEARAART
ncbi:phage recombination protein Bet [Marichromatium sp. AB31]|uniref:phage recombination protein Bet n=1 Tax=Marichromatium sp. AB31 TaxID=2483362 RepID=UPI000F3F317E|nr:phage recombination protein Bet [Marichromatium sp. AB31]RNE89846.1 phage recombination protein Bet [Marichromatium sp. AB31]